MSLYNDLETKIEYQLEQQQMYEILGDRQQAQVDHFHNIPLKAL